MTFAKDLSTFRQLEHQNANDFLWTTLYCRFLQSYLPEQQYLLQKQEVLNNGHIALQHDAFEGQHHDL